MERYNPDRSQDRALLLDQEVSSPARDIFHAPVAALLNEVRERDPAASNGHGDALSTPPPRMLPPSGLESELLATVRRGFDPYLHRLERLKAGLRAAPAEPDGLDIPSRRVPRGSPQPKPRSAPPPYLLRETLVYLERLAHPPLLPAPRVTTFEEAFRRHEPMFHTVFYRKYPPYVLEDAKQEGLLALFRKWLKNKAILDQASAYVTTAAIYGVSNWRQRGMKVRGKEGALVVDAQGKVIGEPHAHGQERWTDRIDLKLDVAQAVEGVLYRYEEQPDYRDIYRVVQHVREDVPFKQGQQASGLSFRAYKKWREEVKEKLRAELRDYALDG